MLMMLHNVDEQEAFNVLRRYSQDLNVKLADVARSVIDSRGKPMFGEERAAVSGRPASLLRQP